MRGEKSWRWQADQLSSSVRRGWWSWKTSAGRRCGAPVFSRAEGKLLPGAHHSVGGMESNAPVTALGVGFCQGNSWSPFMITVNTI